MLPTAQRLRSKGDFHRVIRSGVRSGRRNVVLYALVDPVSAEQHDPRAGLIVSKAVGNAVHRNLIKRRLRSLIRESKGRFPDGTLLVARALAPAGTSNYSQLSEDFNSAQRSVISRLNRDASSFEKNRGEFVD